MSKLRYRKDRACEKQKIRRMASTAEEDYLLDIISTQDPMEEYYKYIDSLPEEGKPDVFLGDEWYGNYITL